MNAVQKIKPPHVGFSAIAVDRLKDIWDIVKHHHAQALEYSFDGTSANQIHGRLLKQELTLIVITIDQKIVASVTIEMFESHRGKICHIFTLGGISMNEWLDDWVETWKAIALEQDCDWLTLKGRKGWEVVSKKYGFEHQYTQVMYNLKG